MNVDIQGCGETGAGHRQSERIPLSQRHLRKTPVQLRKDGFILATALHLLFLAPAYLVRQFLGWPELPVLTWAGLLEWIYILPAYWWLRKHAQAHRANGVLMNAIGVFLVYAFLSAVPRMTT
jgi:hypothetical protein